MFGNINDLMKQAQKVQAQMAEAQEKLAEIIVEGTSGGGMVKATVNGKGSLLKLQLDPSLLNPEEVEILEDLIVAAINDGRSRADEKSAEEMGKVTGGLKLPPGFKLPF